MDTSISGQRVTRVLGKLAEVTGLPQVIVMDNGPEFTSKAMLCWAQQRGVKLHFIDPGKPAQNAYVESFNGKFRDECLNQNWFSDLQEARRKIEDWRREYNRARPTVRWVTWLRRPSAKGMNSHYPCYNFRGKVNPA